LKIEFVAPSSLWVSAVLSLWKPRRSRHGTWLINS
jgi:hypothetical protein